MAGLEPHLLNGGMDGSAGMVSHGGLEKTQILFGRASVGPGNLHLQHALA